MRKINNQKHFCKNCYYHNVWCERWKNVENIKWKHNINNNRFHNCFRSRSDDHPSFLKGLKNYDVFLLLITPCIEKIWSVLNFFFSSTFEIHFENNSFMNIRTLFLRKFSKPVKLKSIVFGLYKVWPSE